MTLHLVNIINDTVVSQAQSQQGGIIGMITPFILVFGIFYFLVILPQKKQQKKHKEMISSLQKGDQVLTNSGIYGRIVEVKEDMIKLEISPKVVVSFQKSVVSSKVVEN